MGQAKNEFLEADIQEIVLLHHADLHMRDKDSAEKLTVTTTATALSTTISTALKSQLDSTLKTHYRTRHALIPVAQPVNGRARIDESR